MIATVRYTSYQAIYNTNYKPLTYSPRAVTYQYNNSQLTNQIASDCCMNSYITTQSHI